MEAVEASTLSDSAATAQASTSTPTSTVEPTPKPTEQPTSTVQHTTVEPTPKPTEQPASTVQQSTGKEEAEEPEKPVFSCCICGLVETCDYYGNTPPFTKPIAFKENVYIMRDPFSPPGTKSSTSYLLLGGECSACGASVCADQVRNTFIPQLTPQFFISRRLGGECSACGASVCADQTSCSVFYAKRFCIRCCKLNYQRFPHEIQKEICKIAASHESSSSSEKPSDTATTR
uniref:Cysteine-rich DPF motif domain-containing protein 1 n=1 Tax=Plectus sambesii TaxID=2011161 RepID=A0A914VQP7_9BILA